jgi:glycosyltransferase involved in cell wall biosynthesis
MARLLVAALERTGRPIALASRLASRNSDGDLTRQADLAAQAVAEIARLTAGPRPAAWVTYHLYYKAPDLIGPAVSRMFGIPYLVAEPSVAHKRAGGRHDAGHRATLAALAQADVALCLTRHDIPCVLPQLGPGGRLVYLPPFLEIGEAPPPARSAPPTLLVVAMMRAGDKLESYRRLAAALALLEMPDWRLTIVGDGPARAEIEALYAPFAARTRWVGAVAPAALSAHYAAADLLVWPAHNEAYGMALLEAQAAGLPVVACRTRGVPDVVEDGRTGLLVPEDDPAAFAGAITALLADPERRVRFGAAAAAWVRRERTLEHAALALDRVLRQVGA